MNKQYFSYFLPLSLSLLGLCTLLSCTEKVQPTQESQTKYGETVVSFCKLVTKCQKEELQKTLVDDIQRRTYLESKMTDQACIDTQLLSIEKNSIEKISTEKNSTEKNSNLLLAFQECNKALNLIEPANCHKQIETLHQNQSCKTALQLP